MSVYAGSVEDSHALIQFFRVEAAKMRNMRKLTITPENTIVQDVNGDKIEFPGLTYGNATLEELLRELGVVFSAQTLHNPKGDSQRKKGIYAERPLDLGARQDSLTWDFQAANPINVQISMVNSQSRDQSRTGAFPD
jgi:hypothetical protein